jgi:cytochrome c553
MVDREPAAGMGKHSAASSAALSAALPHYGIKRQTAKRMARPGPWEWLLLGVLVFLAGCARGGPAKGGREADRPYNPVAYGSQLYSHLCAGCHGEGGKGGSAVALNRPELRQKYPTAESLLRRIKEGDPAAGMPPCPVGDLLPEQQEALAAYLRSLWQ